MRKIVGVAAVVLTTALAPLLLSGATSTAAPAPAGRLVSEVAASGTPHVLNGEVLSVARVGDTILLGGSFSSARNDGSNTTLSRSNLLAFDRQTGQISTTFLPNPNGTVRKVLDAGDGTVWVGGSFTSIGGVSRSRLARIRVSDGSVVGSFNPGTVNGQVRDLALSRGQLWVAGAFTHLNGSPQRALASVDPTTGLRTQFMTRQLAGNHRDGPTQVLKIDVTPDGSRLAAVGNFATLDGVANHQMLMLDTSGGTAVPSTFQTTFYTAGCAAAFDSYMRDVDFSPDGSFFVISTTGAYGGAGSACDSTARFETDAAGADVRPSWINNTGGDTSYGVEITGQVVYVGGHFRWQNNPFRGDAAGPGAVAREGIAALDPVNGLPYTWNPGRTKGVGVFDFLDTDQGLWVASDTDRIGNWQLKSRIARMPANGVQFPAVRTPSLPNEVYGTGQLNQNGPGAGSLTRRTVLESGVGEPTALNGTGVDWSQVRGSFMLNGYLYLGLSDGSFVRRSFDGTTFGAAEPVNGSDQVVTLTDWRNDISQMTSMFYDSGRIYFTRNNSGQLFYRYFTAQSGVVGAQRLVASNGVAGVNFNQVRGMFSNGSKLWFTTGDNNLYVADWEPNAQAGAPVPGTTSTFSGPGVDNRTWPSRSWFLYQDSQGNGAVTVPPPTPVAAFTSDCTELGCEFDASGSHVSEGTIVSYTWDLAGENGSGVRVNRTFAADGTYQITLTVTTAAGKSSSLTVPVTVAATPATETAFVDAVSSNANATNHRVVVPNNIEAGDTMVLAMAVNTVTPTITGPAGWTELRNVSGGNVQGRLWTRRATAADAGSTVTVPLTSTAKADLTLAAYRSNKPTRVLATGADLIDASSTNFAAPGLLTDRAAVVGSYWAGKASTVIGWMPPASMQGRSLTEGAGSGRISAVTADSGGVQPAGNHPGATATTTNAIGKGLSFSFAVGLE